MIRLTILLFSIYSLSASAEASNCSADNFKPDTSKNNVVVENLNKGKHQALLMELTAVNSINREYSLQSITKNQNETLSVKTNKKTETDSTTEEIFSSWKILDVRDTHIEVIAYNDREVDELRPMELRGRIRLVGELPQLYIYEINGVHANQTLSITNLAILFKELKSVELSEEPPKIAWYIYNETLGLNIGNSTGDEIIPLAKKSDDLLDLMKPFVSEISVWRSQTKRRRQKNK